MKRLVAQFILLAVMAPAAVMIALPAAAQQAGEVTRLALQALERHPGFEAVYDASSVGGQHYLIRVQYRRPDKMRLEVEPLNIVMVFDGRRYLYWDRGRDQAILMPAPDVHRELRRQQENWTQIAWLSKAKLREENAVYPQCILGLSQDSLDVALEMSTSPNRHSWVREMSDASRFAVKGGEVTFNSAGEERIRLTVSLDTGLLTRVEVGDPQEIIGTLELREARFAAPADEVFEVSPLSTTNVRDQRSDPTLLQQLLITSLRGTLDTVLTTAKTKWPTLSTAEKLPLKRTMQQCFAQIFGLGRASIEEGLIRSLTAEPFVARVAAAAGDVEARQRFNADHPDLSGEDSEAAWKAQIEEESTRAAMLEIVRLVDEQFVEPVRRQALDATAGMSDADRRELVRYVTDPIHLAFAEIAEPVIRSHIREILNK